MTWNELVEAVTARSGERCEYCRMHQALQGPTFHVEHITPRSRGGVSDLDNLCFACATCNLRKSDRVEILDPDTGASEPLFNPRTQKWAEHFRWDGYRIVGITSSGKVTVLALDLNHRRRLFIRQIEERLGLFST